MSKVGKPWSKEDEDKLLDMVALNTSIEDIATTLQRKSGGISSRLLHIAREEVKAGATIEEASELVKLPVERIRKSLEQSEASLNHNKEKQLKEETLLDVMKEIRTLLKELNSKL